MPSQYYFAYGSNLNGNDWENFCRDEEFAKGLLRPVATGYVADHHLAFTHRSERRKGGTLDILPRIGHVVSGVIFEVLEGGWIALDKKEGAPHSYARCSATAFDERGGEIPVMTYRVVDAKQFVQPSEKYLKVVRDGM